MKAIYHQEAPNKARELDVLKTNEDGTVDLGADGALVVGGCVVSDLAKAGQCTIAKDEATDGDADAKPAKAAKAEKPAKAAK